MSDIILLIALGSISILIILAIKLIARDINRMHKDVRRTIELGFWSQKREIEAKRLLRQQKRCHRMH